MPVSLNRVSGAADFSATETGPVAGGITGTAATAAGGTGRTTSETVTALAGGVGDGERSAGFRVNTTAPATITAAAATLSPIHNLPDRCGVTVLTTGPGSGCAGCSGSAGGGAKRFFSRAAFWSAS